MPRYCAVKLCRNRGGTTSTQDNKRISFYPFPLQDKSRLQNWVDNMGRENWTPSRHQYLCSQHFTEDCFDIRWGIRYLKNTAVPTIFPADDRDDEKKNNSSKRNAEVASECELALEEFQPSAKKKPLILRKAFKMANPIAEGFSEGICELPLVSDVRMTCQPNLTETQSSEMISDARISTLALSSHPDSTMNVMCETPASVCKQEKPVETATLQAALGHNVCFVPVETMKEKPTIILWEKSSLCEEEHISVDEHTYCRPDTDRDQLWNKILCLHAKIMELDRREESTVSKIHTLENEIALLRKDGAVFKEKQKALEDYVTTLLL